MCSTLRHVCTKLLKVNVVVLYFMYVISTSGHSFSRDMPPFYGKVKENKKNGVFIE